MLVGAIWLYYKGGCQFMNGQNGAQLFELISNMFYAPGVGMQAANKSHLHGRNEGAQTCPV
jgi:hypothetical protein